ncbi:unnamed protein product [Soboliphyme baturini]|uniref:Programmed cell death protein 10 n=1 Tax=Soboliphyme baturini TaxID=241478 RepID=A0A183J1P0_9BILA|nr:unnamed protein product [Soboliphyme baturini]
MSSSSAEEAYLAHVTYDLILSPAISKLEAKNRLSVSKLRSALLQAEQEHCGFALELVRFIRSRSELDIDLQEVFLRLHKHAPNDDLQLNRAQPLLAALSDCAIMLRLILSRIPDEIGDRRKFLDTIKEIASSIKRLLDATNSLIMALPEDNPVEARKRDFVKYSKRFSNTLKDFFRGERDTVVFKSANQLIYQTMLIIKVVREKVVL